MTTLADWMADHAVPLWILLSLLIVLVGDLAWRRSVHRRVTGVAGDHPSGTMLPRTTVTLGVLATLLFSVVAFAVSTKPSGGVVRFDGALAAGMHAHLSRSILHVASRVSVLGGTPWVVMLSTLTLLILLLRRQWRLSACWAIAQIGLLPLSHGLKACFQRARPPHDSRFVTDAGWSFPSGHAVNSVVLYGMLAYVLLQLIPTRWHRAVLATTLLMVSLIGLSRILVQAHYFSDVVAGYACGLMWLMLCIGLAEHLQQRQTP